MTYRACLCLRKSLWTALVIGTFAIHVCFSDIRYSIPEEKKQGSVVGKIAQDLGINRNMFLSRNPRIEFEGGSRFCEINAQTGDLVVSERIDREELCGQKTVCILDFDVFIENPLELQRVTIEIVDINDNFPFFPHAEIYLEIPESEDKGARFSIDEALDADIGANAVQRYMLTDNEYFSLTVHTNAETGKYAELLLDNELDREKQDKHTLLITAYDGGNPPKSGTVLVSIRILDVNDNKPVFKNPIYKVSIPENIPLESLVVTVNATDADDGPNGEVIYEFSHISGKAKGLFSVDPKTGQIAIKGKIDFEDTSSFEIRIKAKDGAGQASTCKVIIDVIDVNDNAPIIMVKSLKSPVAEDSLIGEEVALLYVQDKDMESSGTVKCMVQNDAPFKLKPSVKNHFSLVTSSILDREKTSEYNITIIAMDEGSPPLSSYKSILLLVADVNDNYPEFDGQKYSAYVAENNKPGISICSVLAADPDWGQNGTILYSLMPGEINGIPVSSVLSINPDSGVIHAVRSFDYEKFRNFKVLVAARDNGSPPLSSNVTVSVFITDENDNTPQILYPAPEEKSLMTELVPKAALSGSLISKVIAVDADSGQNAWLSFHILQSTQLGLFSIGLHSGEIRALRDITESDSMKQNLVISVKDNGQPPLSATCSVYLLISDNPAEVPELKDMTESSSKLTFYLIIALVSVSTFFLTFFILIVAVKFCHRKNPRLLFDGAVAIPSAYLPPNYAEVEGAGTLRSSYNYDGYLTTGSHTSDFKFVTSYNDKTLSASGSLKKSPDDSNIISLLDSCNTPEVR